MSARPVIRNAADACRHAADTLRKKRNASHDRVEREALGIGSETLLELARAFDLIGHRPECANDYPGDVVCKAGCPIAETPPAAEPARLDAEGTAVGKTRLVTHVRGGDGRCVAVGPADTYVAEDGTRVSLDAEAWNAEAAARALYYEIGAATGGKRMMMQAALQAAYAAGMAEAAQIAEDHATRNTDIRGVAPVIREAAKGRGPAGGGSGG